MKTVVLCVFIAFLGGGNAHKEGDCPAVCPKRYSPICASDGYENKTFDNDCIMLQYNCKEKRKYRELRPGPCKDSDIPRNQERSRWNCGMCSDVLYAPVCGYDGYETETFTHQCTLDVYNCLTYRRYRTISFGPCRGKDISKGVQRKKPDCGDCSKVYDPVCSYDGYGMKTFSNQCMVDLYNCANRGNYVTQRRGACF